MGDVRLNAQVFDYEPETSEPAGIQHRSVSTLLDTFVVTEEMVEEMMDAEIIWSNTIVRGHVQVWAAPANGGKTTIAMCASNELANAGFNVLYFQEDAGGSDMKQLVDAAKSGGYKLLNSTLGGKSVNDIVKTIRMIAKSREDLSNDIFIFDTLKKFCDLMGKGASREFFSLMRSLSALGGTVILLGHTNKNLDFNGKPIFEGVGDVRNDVDELFYFSRSEPNANGDILVGVEPDKVRSLVKATSYKITADRKVIPIETERSIADIKKIQHSRNEYQDLIAFVNDHLDKHQAENLTSLAEVVRDNCGIGLNKAKSIILEHSGAYEDDWVLWLRTKVTANNAVRISKKA